MSIDVNNESGTATDDAALVDVARHTLDSLRIHPLAELSLVLVDEPAMTRLNEQWMESTGPTDVLSFPMDELRPTADDDEPVEGLLGDVVLCPTVAQRQAETAGHSMQAELELLCVHGVLHLLGYDHAVPDEEHEMFGLQRRLLDEWRAGRAGQVTTGEQA